MTTTRERIAKGIGSELRRLRERAETAEATLAEIRELCEQPYGPPYGSTAWNVLRILKKNDQNAQ